MSETGPQLFLFSHELERVRARRGAGVAIVVDRHAGTPEIVHLHLAEPPPACGRDTLPLVWSFGAPEEGGDQADDATGVRLWIDDSTMPVRARARLRTAAPQRAEHEAEVEIIRTGHAAFTRNAPVLETDALARRSVLCIGLGSGGSAVADQLARSGVGRFVLWDHDRLESHNIGRHICTLRDIGRRKVLAVRDHILAVNPAAQVETVHTDVLYASDRLAEIMETVDGVIAGTDNNASRFAINDAACAPPALPGMAAPIFAPAAVTSSRCCRAAARPAMPATPKTASSTRKYPRPATPTASPMPTVRCPWNRGLRSTSSPSPT